MLDFISTKVVIMRVVDNSDDENNIESVVVSTGCSLIPQYTVNFPLDIPLHTTSLVLS